MAHWIVFVALLVSTLALATKEEEAQNTDYDYEDDYYDDLEAISDSEEIQETEDTTPPAQAIKEIRTVKVKEPEVLEVERDKEELTTEKQMAQYEVTELVIDVPDESTRRVPFINNFTVTRPLNLAGVSTNKIGNGEKKIKDEGDEVINSVLMHDRAKFNKNSRNVKGSDNNFDVKVDKSDYFHHFKPTHSFEEEFHKLFGNEEEFEDFNFKEETNPSKSFKDYFHNFKKNVANDFKNVVNKHKDSIYDSLRKFVNGPISIFDKLHRKNSDSATKLHEDDGYHEFDHNHGDDCRF